MRDPRALWARWTAMTWDELPHRAREQWRRQVDRVADPPRGQVVEPWPVSLARLSEAVDLPDLPDLADPDPAPVRWPEEPWGRTYAFDSSTTTVSLVSSLPDLPFRAVTNAYVVLEYLVNMENVEVISTGGRYHPNTKTFVGGDSINTLRRHHVHTAFISCIGFETDRGASEGFEQQATFKERLVQFAEEVVLLVDSSKLNQRSEYYFAEVARISRVITDNKIDPAFANEIRSRGMKLTIAEE